MTLVKRQKQRNFCVLGGYGAGVVVHCPSPAPSPAFKGGMPASLLQKKREHACMNPLSYPNPIPRKPTCSMHVKIAAGGGQGGYGSGVAVRCPERMLSARRAHAECMPPPALAIARPSYAECMPPAGCVGRGTPRVHAECMPPAALATARPTYAECMPPAALATARPTCMPSACRQLRWPQHAPPACPPASPLHAGW